ncbi:hypothetical protein IT575_01005 [bacterium]|nr:hypothetical protein [bacterium]
MAFPDKNANRPLVYLFHWKDSEADALRRELQTWGFKVEVESEIGARGGKAVLDSAKAGVWPAALLFSLRRDARLSRETAAGLRGFEQGQGLRLVFFDGEEAEIAATRARVPDAEYLRWEELRAALEAGQPASAA